MATIKVKIRLSSVEGKEGTLFYQVIHGRVARQIKSGYRLLPTEWDERSENVILPLLDADRKNYLLKLKKNVTEDILRLKYIIRKLECSKDTYTSDKIVELYHDRTASEAGGFISFTENLVTELKRIGRVRTAETYTTVLNSFMRFWGKRDDIPLDGVDSSLIVEYETWLRAKDICPNSSSFYMRNLRAIYNRAIEKGLAQPRNPFKHVYTGVDKTVKRAVPLKVIRQIRELDLTLSPSASYARDLFMFSFYTRGMSFIDMAFLKKKDLQNGILSYRRHKTGQQLFIKWEKPMQEIIDKYDTGNTPYLLPIIMDTGKDERRQYKNAAHLVNEKLKQLGMQLLLAVPLTMYVSRHSWASAAKSKNVPLSVISEGMGHDSEKTTRIYLASLDTSIVDKANSLILKSL